MQLSDFLNGSGDLLDTVKIEFFRMLPRRAQIQKIRAEINSSLLKKYGRMIKLEAGSAKAMPRRKGWPQLIHLPARLRQPLLQLVGQREQARHSPHDFKLLCPHQRFPSARPPCHGRGALILSRNSRFSIRRFKVR
jgi:hypothetical protein